MIHSCCYCCAVTRIDDTLGPHGLRDISHGFCETCNAVLMHNFEHGFSTAGWAIRAARGLGDISYRIVGAKHGPACQR